MRYSGNKLSLVVFVLIAAIAGYVFWQSSVEFSVLEERKGGLGYVSDETWYVSASRVILVRLFKAEPRQVERYGATVVFREKVQDEVYLVILSRQLGLNITFYKNIPAVYVAGSRNMVQEFIEKTSERYTVDVVIPGWTMPDREHIHIYLNWEHPPLGKYLIALSMYALGDEPVYWRIPVVIAGALTVLLVLLVLEKLTRNMLVAIAGAVLLVMDTLSRALFSIALLDGYVALFTTLALYLAVNKKYNWALLAGLTGALFKASSLFTVIPIVILLARRDAKTKPLGPTRVRAFLLSALFYTFSAVLLYLSMLTLASLPLIAYMGVVNWFTRAVLGSAKWHLSVKCIGAHCPQSSAPWDWFLGLNSFPLYVYPGGRVLYATGITPLWVTSAVLLVLALPAIYTGVKEYGYIVLFYLGVFSGYVLTWILGGRTQYSFYSIHLAPMVYVNLVYVVNLLTSKNTVNKLVSTWFNLLQGVLDKLVLY
ncbi:MAG: glycosyl transferase family 39 [Desulfurococcaceae archaeon]